MVEAVVEAIPSTREIHSHLASLQAPGSSALPSQYNTCFWNPSHSRFRKASLAPLEQPQVKVATVAYSQPLVNSPQSCSSTRLFWDVSLTAISSNLQTRRMLKTENKYPLWLQLPLLSEP